jgi:hypothetical protein
VRFDVGKRKAYSTGRRPVVGQNPGAGQIVDCARRDAEQCGGLGGCQQVMLLCADSTLTGLA